MLQNGHDDRPSSWAAMINLECFVSLEQGEWIELEIKSADLFDLVFSLGLFTE